ncbi:DNA topoisomerase, partial [Acinetobacter baumannii]
PGAKSAGRVQSVALRLICERETEIEAFKAREYWTIDVDLGAGAQPFTARLAQLDGARLDKFDLADEAAAKAVAARLGSAQFRVADVTVKP